MMSRFSAIPSRARRLAVLLLSCSAVPAFAQPDPAANGPFAFSTAEYTEGDDAFTPTGFPAPVEFTAVVHYPTDLSRGPFPLVLYLHGRHVTCTGPLLAWPCPAGASPIRSYRGYNYSARQLATHGYIVVSASANGINARDNGTPDLGMRARAELIDRHLVFWRTLNTTGAPPFGTQFMGKVDLSRIGTMGHSRGGEGVMRHFSYNAAKPEPFPLKMIVPIAPTDYFRWKVHDDVAVAQLLPYCDGDVYPFDGVHYYDDARHRLTGTAYHSYVTVMGANHNFFNTVWTPGTGADADPAASDDWLRYDTDLGVDLRTDPYCGMGAGNGRLTPAQQRDVGVAYLAAFFRTEVGGEVIFDQYIEGPYKPPTVFLINLHTSHHGRNALRHDLNRLLTEAHLTTNHSGGGVTSSGLAPYEMCGGEPPQPEHCQPAGTLIEQVRQPHTFGYDTAPERGLSQLHAGWSSTTATYVNQIPPGPERDVSRFGYFQFRVAVDVPDGRNPPGTDPDFRVRFTDGAGRSDTVRVGASSNALFYPPGTVGPVPKALHNTVQLALSTVTGVDFGDLAEVAFIFDQLPSGALLFSDLHFYGHATPTDRCPDDTCNGDETCESCPEDCGECGPYCGDGACNGAETCATCEIDCGPCSVCGNEECEFGEDEYNCCLDCACTEPNFQCQNNVCVCVTPPFFCPDGVCESACGQQETCPADCGGGGPACGNGACEPGETSCCQDCGCEPGYDCLPSGQCECTAMFICGDGVCESACGQQENCDADCGGGGGGGGGGGTCYYGWETGYFCCYYGDCCGSGSCYYELAAAGRESSATRKARPPSGTKSKPREGQSRRRQP